MHSVASCNRSVGVLLDSGSNTYPQNVYINYSPTNYILELNHLKPFNHLHIKSYVPTLFFASLVRISIILLF